MILKSQRELFDIPRDVIYLNAAYMTPSTLRMEEIGRERLEALKSPWKLGAEAFFTETEETRTIVGDVFGVSPETIAFAPSASYGIAVAARNVSVNKGDAILVLEGQFPSNVYEWRKLAADNGGEIVTVKVTGNHDWTQAILETIEGLGDRLAVAALPNVHWSNGAYIDLGKVSQQVKAKGAALVLDLTQSMGAMPTDLNAIDPDFAIMAGYKWLFGPYSTGYIYVAERHHEGQSLEHNWIARDKSEDFERLLNYCDEFQPGARRFDVGERSNFTLMPLMQEAIRQVAEWGVDNIAESLAAINTQLADICRGAGFKPIADECRGNHILGVDVGLERGEKLMTKLQAGGVSASLRGNMLRLAPHLWTDEEDIAKFGKILASL